MLDNLNDLLNDSLVRVSVIRPNPTEQAGLTMPPTAIKRPTRPTVATPQPTDQTPTPTDKK